MERQHIVQSESLDEIIEDISVKVGTEGMKGNVSSNFSIIKLEESYTASNCQRV